mgnify:CR=1 FL=1
MQLLCPCNRAPYLHDGSPKKAERKRPDVALNRKPIEDNFVEEEQADVPEQVQKDPRLADRPQEGDGHDLGQELGGRVDQHEEENKAAPSRGNEAVEVGRFPSLLWRGVQVVRDEGRAEAGCQS